MKDIDVLNGFLTYSKKRKALGKENSKNHSSVVSSEDRIVGVFWLFVHLFSCILCVLNFEYGIIDNNFIFILPLLIAVIVSFYTNDSAGGILSASNGVFCFIYIMNQNIFTLIFLILGLSLSFTLTVFYRYQMIESVVYNSNNSYKSHNRVNENLSLYNTAINYNFSENFIRNTIKPLPDTDDNVKFKKRVFDRYNSINNTNIDFSKG